MAIFRRQLCIRSASKHVALFAFESSLKVIIRRLGTLVVRKTHTQKRKHIPN